MGSTAKKKIPPLKVQNIECRSFQMVAEGFFWHGIGLPPLWRHFLFGLLFAFGNPEEGA